MHRVYYMHSYVYIRVYTVRVRVCTCTMYPYILSNKRKCVLYLRIVRYAFLRSTLGQSGADFLCVRESTNSLLICIRVCKYSTVRVPVHVLYIQYILTYIQYMIIETIKHTMIAVALKAECTVRVSKGRGPQEV